MDQLVADERHHLQVADRAKVALQQRGRADAAAAEPGGLMPGEAGTVVVTPPVRQATSRQRRHHLEVAPGAVGALDQGGDPDDPGGEGRGGLGPVGMPLPGPTVVPPVVVQVPPALATASRLPTLPKLPWMRAAPATS